MRVLDPADQVRWTGRVADAPARGVEGFADGVHGDGLRCICGGEAGEANEFRAVGEVLVDFVGENDEVVFDGDVTDGGQFVGGEDFSERVVSMQVGFFSVAVGTKWNGRL